MPSLPLPPLSKKGGAGEYAAFDEGESNNPLPPPPPPTHPPAQSGGADNDSGGGGTATSIVMERESGSISRCTAAETHRRQTFSVGGGGTSSFRIGEGDERMERGRRGGRRGGGCCWRLSMLQVVFVAVGGTCLLYLMSDGLRERRVLAWLEGVLIHARPRTTLVTTGLLLSLGLVLVTLGFPTTLLAVLGGHVYSDLLSGPLPVLVASLVVTATSSLACCLAFFLTRAMLRDVASEVLYSHPRLAALDAVLTQQGLRLNLLLRLCPFLPFSLLNVLMGLTATRPEDFILGCLVGMLPSVILLAYLGGAEGGREGGVEGVVASFGERHPVEARLVYAGGAVLLVLVGGVVWRATRKEAREEEVRKQSVVDSLGWEM